MIEIIEHTADVGIRVKTKSLKDLFLETAWGMLQFIIDERSDRTDFTLEFSFSDCNLSELMMKYLSEILYLVQDKYFLPHRIEIHEISERDIRVSLHASIKGRLIGEIKNITYHNFRIGQVEDYWLCEVIFDI